eukprot:1630068-Pyramimonas_sp.AAC.1
MPCILRCSSNAPVGKVSFKRCSRSALNHKSSALRASNQFGPAQEMGADVPVASNAESRVSVES